MDWSRFREAVRQGCVDPWAASVRWKDSPSPPPAPNYAAAAATQGAANVQTALTQALLNRPNESTPLGDRIWTQTGTTTVPSTGSGTKEFQLPTFSSSINMTPEGQNLYDQQMGLSTGLMGLGQSSLDQTRASLGQPQDFGSVQDIADQSYGMQTARLDPQWQQNEGMQKNALANQGLVAGGEAYDNAMRTFNQGKNDAYNQLLLNGRQQANAELLQERQQPINEMIALMNGQQLASPQYANTPQTQVSGTDIAGLISQQYQGKLATQNAMMGGLFGLGGSALGAAGSYFKPTPKPYTGGLY